MGRSAVLARVLGVLFLLAPAGAIADSAAVFPPPIPSPAYGGFTVSHGVVEIPLGQQIAASWTAAPPGGSDWIGLYEAGASDGYYRGYCYTYGSAAGSCALQPPSAFSRSGLSVAISVSAAT